MWKGKYSVKTIDLWDIFHYNNIRRKEAKDERF